MSSAKKAIGKAIRQISTASPTRYLIKKVTGKDDIGLTNWVGRKLEGGQGRKGAPAETLEAPTVDNEEQRAAAAREVQRRYARRGRAGTALSAATGGDSYLG
jgi:hypothetical protein